MALVWRPDIVILDIGLYESGSLGVAETIRKGDVLWNTGIAYTALDEAKAWRLASGCWLNAYCQKGAFILTLLKLIDRMVDNYCHAISNFDRQKLSKAENLGKCEIM